MSVSRNLEVRRALQHGLVIPACPLALTSGRELDPRRQRALCRYYHAAGAGGLAVGVHTTQFAIHDSKIGLFKPVLELAVGEMNRFPVERQHPFVRIAGVCGERKQALAEAGLIRQLGYDAALLNLAALKTAGEDELIDHCRAVAEILPVIGFYLQPLAGGCVLPHSFWRRFAEIDNVVAIKIAPFNRYQTIEVVRAVAESGREDIALYTGNDDNIVLDLLTPFRFNVGGKLVERRMVGGLLGHWAVWTRRAVELLDECHQLVRAQVAVPAELLSRSAQITDANAAFFDASHQFAGCIAGLHEVLRRQGIFEGIWCLDPRETLSPGQADEIDRVYRAYPGLNDDDFVQEHVSDWLK